MVTLSTLLCLSFPSGFCHISLADLWLLVLIVTLFFCCERCTYEFLKYYEFMFVLVYPNLPLNFCMAVLQMCMMSADNDQEIFQSDFNLILITTLDSDGCLLSEMRIGKHLYNGLGTLI